MVVIASRDCGIGEGNLGKVTANVPNSPQLPMKLFDKVSIYSYMLFFARASRVKVESPLREETKIERVRPGGTHIPSCQGTRGRIEGTHWPVLGLTEPPIVK